MREKEIFTSCEFAGTNGTENEKTYTATLWQKYGKSRIYVKLNGVDCGWIDTITGEKSKHNYVLEEALKYVSQNYIIPEV